MTKFDITTWFCKVVALTGMASGGVWLLGNLSTRLFSPSSSVTDYTGSAFSFAVYLFVGLFAQSLGAEMSCENRDSAVTITSRDLNWLLLRCAGFGLFINGFISSSENGIRILYFHFANSHIMPGYDMMMVPYVAIGFVVSLIGFFLAFGPRLAQRFRSP